MDYTSRAYALLNKDDKRHVKEIQQFLDPRREDKILEIGCGRGFLTKRIQEISPHTYGIDVNPAAIALGVAENLSVMDSQNLDFEDSSFDKVYSYHTIEHVSEPQKMFKEIERVLRPGGKVLLVYPAEPIRGMFSMVAALIIFKNPFRAREIHLHKFNPKKIQDMLRDSKLEYVESNFSLLSSPQYFTILQKRLS